MGRRSIVYIRDTGTLSVPHTPPPLFPSSPMTGLHKPVTRAKVYVLNINYSRARGNGNVGARARRLMGKLLQGETPPCFVAIPCICTSRGRRRKKRTLSPLAHIPHSSVSKLLERILHLEWFLWGWIYIYSELIRLNNSESSRKFQVCARKLRILRISITLTV